MLGNSDAYRFHEESSAKYTFENRRLNITSSTIPLPFRVRVTVRVTVRVRVRVMVTDS